MLAPVRRITSRQNAIVERYRAAARSSEHGWLLDGVHLVRDAAHANVSIQSAMVTTASLANHEVQSLVTQLERRDTAIFSVTPHVMAAASPVRSPSPIVALAAPRPSGAEGAWASTTPLVIVASDVQDPGNLGAIIRVAEAGGATGVIVAGQSADPFGWKAMRGSMGSALRMPIARHDDLKAAVSAARSHRCRIVATVPRGGTSLFNAPLDGPLAILVGSEGTGLPQDQVDDADERISIPMASAVESLNTAVTAALVLYESRRRQDRP